MSLFYINPQGQHDLHALGGDEDESVGMHDAGSRAVASAAGGGGIEGLIGLATLPVLEPAGPLLGAEVSAYTGSLIGALGGMKQSEEAATEIAAHKANNRPPPEPAILHDAKINSSASDSNEVAARQPGVMLAVAVTTAKQSANAEIILGRYAFHIQQSKGDLRDGDWIEFDPLTTHEQTG